MISGSNHIPAGTGIAARLVLSLATSILLLGCGGSGSPAPSTPAATAVEATPGGAGSTDGAATTDDAGPIGGDVGDRSKGSIQAQISGDMTASLDIPYAANLARLEVDGPNTGYLPFTDPEQGTLFLTFADSGLLVQYAAPNQTGLTNGATPCELHLDSFDANGAKGSFTCKGMLLVKNDGMGSVDMTASFEGHK